jgi:hypothetical protein
MRIVGSKRGFTREDIKPRSEAQRLGFQRFPGKTDSRVLADGPGVHASPKLLTKWIGAICGGQNKTSVSQGWDCVLFKRALPNQRRLLDM